MTRATPTVASAAGQRLSAARADNRFARTILTLNMLFSLTSGLLLLLAAPLVGGWLGLTGVQFDAILRLLGGGVVLFGLFAGWVARQQPVSRSRLLGIAVADFGWVVLSLILLLTRWIALSTGGMWLVAITADVVLLLGVLELFAWRRLRRSG